MQMPQTLIILGKKYSIEIFPKRFLKNKVLIEKDRLIIFLAENESNSKAKLLLETFLIEFARKYISARVNYFVEKYDFSFNKIAIKEQKSRWGSCSSLKNLNFNWRLIFAPVDVIDYVIVHELSHTRQMNHSADFWNEVKNCMPEFKVQRDWLKSNGKQLFKVF